MKHLLISREYPPASYPAGGIGTYARHIAHLLAEAGETVHVIGQRWDGAPERREVLFDGRLVIHRIALDEDLSSGLAGEVELLGMLAWSKCPSQVFSWQVARCAERLIDDEQIDLIEAQEWEAPLYYLLVRRALGLGPERQPPCVVHLHSPSAMVFQYNEWDTTLDDYLPLVQMEEYCIRAADALLCPSECLARGVAKRYGLDASCIDVVRYAMGDSSLLAREASAWGRNAVCYVGRLELRKGVLEWVDAAVQVANVDASVSFDFFGSDTSVDGGVGRSVQHLLESRIPTGLRERFHFHGSRSRDELMRALAKVSLAVVPSRWENMPFTCIEAMATGLPVLVSPSGGMAELVEDGISGWVAADGSAQGLAASLLRALATPAERRAEMGSHAVARVRSMCGNGTVVEQQIALRRKVVKAGAMRSASVPGSLAKAHETGRSGIGVLEVLAGVQGLDTLLQHSPGLLGVSLASNALVMSERFAAVCDEVFARQPGVALVVPWQVVDVKQREVETGQTPVSLDELQGDLPAGCCVRVEALIGPGGSVKPLRWETLAAGGWAAVTYPEVLVERRVSAPRRKRRYSGMALIQNQTPAFALAWFMAAPIREKLRWLGRMVGKPARVFRWVGWQLTGGTK